MIHCLAHDQVKCHCIALFFLFLLLVASWFITGMYFIHMRKKTLFFSHCSVFWVFFLLYFCLLNQLISCFLKYFFLCNVSKFRAIKTLNASIHFLRTWWNGGKQDPLCFGFEALGALKKETDKKIPEKLTKKTLWKTAFFPPCECGTLLLVLECQMLRSFQWKPWKEAFLT